jgi:hypothetical protein
MVLLLVIGELGFEPRLLALGHRHIDLQYLERLHGLVDREAARLLPRRELSERLYMLRVDRLGRDQEKHMVSKPEVLKYVRKGQPAEVALDPLSRPDLQ